MSSEKESNANIPQLSSITPTQTIQPNHHSQSKNKGPYIIGETLGEGAFAKVKLATQAHTKEKVAIKILSKRHLLKDNNDILRIKKEINILKKLCHKNIIQLYEIIEGKKSLFLIMEYCEGGELFDYIVEKKRLKEQEACHLFQQIINGVEYLHSQNIIHRDLKPENLLLDYNKNIKISDFGLSTFSDRENLLQTPCGTPSYAPPEMLNGDDYNGTCSDIWSCGIILFAMLCGSLPFCESKEDIICKRILSHDYTIPGHVSRQAHDLLNKIMKINPMERYDIKMIKKHPWFNLITPKLKPGLLVGIETFPIDENILNMLEEYGLDKEKCRNNLMTNRFDSITSVYFLCLKKFIRDGGKSVSDVDSDLFEQYIMSQRYSKGRREVNINKNKEKSKGKNQSMNSNTKKQLKKEESDNDEENNGREISKVNSLKQSQKDKMAHMTIPSNGNCNSEPHNLTQTQTKIKPKKTDDGINNDSSTKVANTSNNYTTNNDDVISSIKNNYASIAGSVTNSNQGNAINNVLVNGIKSKSQKSNNLKISNDQISNINPVSSFKKQIMKSNTLGNNLQEPYTENAINSITINDYNNTNPQSTKQAKHKQINVPSQNNQGTSAMIKMNIVTKKTPQKQSYKNPLQVNTANKDMTSNSICITSPNSHIVSSMELSSVLQKKIKEFSSSVAVTSQKDSDILTSPKQPQVNQSKTINSNRQSFITMNKQQNQIISMQREQYKKNRNEAKESNSKFQHKSNPCPNELLNMIDKDDDESFVIDTNNQQPVNVIDFISKRLVASSFCSIPSGADHQVLSPLKEDRIHQINCTSLITDTNASQVIPFISFVSNANPKEDDDDNAKEDLTPIAECETKEKTVFFNVVSLFNKSYKNRITKDYKNEINSKDVPEGNNEMNMTNGMSSSKNNTFAKSNQRTHGNNSNSNSKNNNFKAVKMKEFASNKPQNKTNMTIVTNKTYKNDKLSLSNGLSNYNQNKPSLTYIDNRQNVPHPNKFLDISTNYDPGLDSRGESSVERSLSIKSDFRNMSMSPESRKLSCSSNKQVITNKTLNSSFNGNKSSTSLNGLNYIGVISEDDEFKLTDKKFRNLKRAKNGYHNIEKKVTINLSMNLNDNPTTPSNSNVKRKVK